MQHCTREQQALLIREPHKEKFLGQLGGEDVRKVV